MTEQKLEIPTLEETIKLCIQTPELIKEYERLLDKKFVPSSPIEKMIDEATGYDKKLAHDFFNFVRDYIWMPVVAQMIKEKIQSKE